LSGLRDRERKRIIHDDLKQCALSSLGKAAPSAPMHSSPAVFSLEKALLFLDTIRVLFNIDGLKKPMVFRS